jgi:CRISPR-associated protein Cmr1
MRKQPEVSPPEAITAKQPNNVITQVREYQLITPLYGGGVKPTEADPVTVVRATEIRGHLRFWWRARQGGKFNSSLAEMKKEEDTIWGKAYKKGERMISQEQVIQITVDVDSSRRGEPVKPFIITEKRRPKSVNNIPGYAAFPLQPDRDELRKRDPHIPDVRSGVSFTLTISFPEGRREDVEAALWAWETFGGIGARTRRGFGALHLLKIDGVSYTKQPFSNNVKEWINEKLIAFVEPGVPPANIPHLSRGAQLAVTSADNVMRVWKRLIDKLNSFRQAGRPGRSVWPEAEAIRAISSGKGSDDEDSPHSQKFPRAALGLPIIFHFKDDSDPEDTTLKEAGEKMERFASPLILRPFLCRDNRAVGLILLLEGSRVDLENLVLEDQDKIKHPVKGTLTKSEAQMIAVLNDETDVLQAFMKKEM